MMVGRKMFPWKKYFSRKIEQFSLQPSTETPNLETSIAGSRNRKLTLAESSNLLFARVRVHASIEIQIILALST
jgi:hypothetical protein